MRNKMSPNEQFRFSCRGCYLCRDLLSRTLRWEETDRRQKTSLSQISLALRLTVMGQVKRKRHKILHCVWCFFMATLSLMQGQNTQHPSVSQRNVRHFLLFCSYPAPPEPGTIWFNPLGTSSATFCHFLPPGIDFIQRHFYISSLPLSACLITHPYHIY